jgi:hypothetical protein
MQRVPSILLVPVSTENAVVLHHGVAPGVESATARTRASANTVPGMNNMPVIARVILRGLCVNNVPMGINPPTTNVNLVAQRIPTVNHRMVPA